MRFKGLLYSLSSIGGLGVLGATSYVSYHFGTKNAKVEETVLQKTTDNPPTPGQIPLNNKVLGPKDLLIKKLTDIKGKYLIANIGMLFREQKVTTFDYETNKHFFKIMKNFVFNTLVSNNISISFNDLDLIENINKLEWKKINIGKSKLKKIYEKNDDSLWKKIPSFKKDSSLTTSGGLSALKIKLKIKNSQGIDKEIILNTILIYMEKTDWSEYTNNMNLLTRIVLESSSKSVDKKDKNKSILQEKDWVYNLEIPKKYYIDSHYSQIINSISSYIKNSMSSKNIFHFENYLSPIYVYGIFDNKGEIINNLNLGKNLQNKTSPLKIYVIFRGQEFNLAKTTRGTSYFKISLKFV